MSYMDLLAGNTRTNAPIVGVATIGNRMDARNVAAARVRQDDDSADFRAMRSLMGQRTGVCG